MEKEKRIRNEDVEDSAQDKKSYPSKVDLDVGELTGLHNLSPGERNQIAKDIHDLDIKSLYNRGDIVFLKNEVIEDGYKIPKHALCWVEQILIMLEKIEENVDKKVAEKEKENLSLAERIRLKMTKVQKKVQRKEEGGKINIKGENEYKVHYVLFYDFPNEKLEPEAAVYDYAPEDVPEDGFIMFSVEENDIFDNNVIDTVIDTQQ
jgi:hypothetical protein